MLAGAIEIRRSLWRGGYQSFRGEHFTVEDARVFDLPDPPVPIAVAGGTQAAGLAAEFGDQLISDRPDPEVVDAYRNAGGAGSIWTQIAVCWGEDASRALQLARDHFRFSALGWKVMSELPNPVNFDAATETVTPEHLAASIPAGPDVDRYVDAVRTATDAGFERVAFVQIGDDQEGWFRFWTEELAPRLAAPTHEPAAAGV